MASNQLLGLFRDIAATTNALAQLRQLGVTDDRITVMSSVPYEPEMLTRPTPKGRLEQIVLLGAVVGIGAGLFLTVGLFLLYPVIQGGQPLVPVPPSLIIIFEVMMLAVMVAAFIGFVLVNKFPTFGQPGYNARITMGDIGVLVQVDEQSSPQVERIMRASGAHDVQRLDETRRENNRAWATFLAVVVGLIIVAAGLPLPFAFNVWRIPIPNQMVEQESIGYEQGPRLAAPAGAIPVQGPVLIAGQPASSPFPATADSLQRGKVLYGLTCVICHGPAGNSNGRLSGFFPLKPFDLTSAQVQALSDRQMFLVITQGFGVMPSLAENLDVQNRWDVINYVRTLKK